MNILIIIPRYMLSNKKNYEYMFPLGLGYISSVIKKEGYYTDCLNLNHFEGTIEEIIKKSLDAKKYDIVCTGNMGIGYLVLEKIINSVRIHSSTPKIILGGAIITPEPEFIFKALKPDFGVLGEGEVTIIELLNAIKNNKCLDKVDGIIYWKEGKPFITKSRKLIEDLDSLPLPDFQGFNFEEQLSNMSSNSSPYGLFDFPRTYPVMSSRGCPFHCTFCYHCLGLKYRTRSIPNVINELKFAIKKYKINTICIYDDLFSVNKKRLYEFCYHIKKLLKEIDWECKWTCQLSVINVNKGMLKVLKDSGCYAVSFGFESYNQKVLNSMKKPITPKMIDNAIKLTLKSGLVIQGNFIFGDRAETKETAKITLDYWKKECKGQIHIGFVQPYPGSEIYDLCVKKEIITDKLDFIKNKMHYFNWFNMTDNMTDKEILWLKKEILVARDKYSKCTIPLKITSRTDYPSRYDLIAKCPFCSKVLNYNNNFIQDKLVYILPIFCRACKMRFNIVSPLYKRGIKYHYKLNFFIQKYLILRERIFRNKI